MPLTQPQRDFLQKYLGRGSDVIDRADLDRAAARPGGTLEEQRHELIGMLQALSTPATASADEARDIARMRVAALGSMDHPLTAAGMTAAATLIDDIEAALARHRDRLAAEQGRRDRKLAIETDLAKIASLLEPDLGAEDAAAIARETEAAIGVLAPDIPTDDALDAAAAALSRLRDRAEAANEAARAARARRAEVAAKLAGDARLAAETIDHEAPDRAALTAEAVSLAVRLAQPLTDSLLTDAGGDLDALKSRIAKANQAAEAARAERARKRQEILAVLTPDTADLPAAEAEALIAAAGKVRALLPEAPVETDLAAAAEALMGFEALRTRTAEALAARKARVARAGTALSAAVWNAGALIPAAAAPSDRVAPLAEEAAKLAAELTACTDLTKAHDWGEERIAGLEVVLSALQDKVRALNKFVAEEQKKLVAAVQGAEAAVAATKGIALSDTQQTALREAIEEARAPAAADLSKLAEAEKALAGIAVRAVTLRRALAALDVRVRRLSATPAGALASELALLDQARKAALDALGKVAP